MLGLKLACAALLCLSLAACKEEMFSNLNEQQANRMMALLIQRGIPVSKTVGREGQLSLHVDSTRFADAMAILEAHGLPGQEFESLGDVFRKEGLVSSPVEERARLIYAMSQELSRTVAEIDGVLAARIHVVLPESDMLGRDLKPSSASVFIRHRPQAPMNDSIPQIKQLVANSIEGLSYDNVSVVNFAANPGLNSGDDQVAQLSRVAGIWVHPADARQAWWMVAAAVLVAALSLGLNVVLARRSGLFGQAQRAPAGGGDLS